MQADVLWFAYLAVEKSALREGQCHTLIDSLGPDVNLQQFVRAVVDTKLCEDYPAVQELMREAARRGLSGELPPANYLRSNRNGALSKTLVVDRSQFRKPPRRDKR